MKQENKQVTAEEATELIAESILEPVIIGLLARSVLKNTIARHLREYATLKTQQLTAERDEWESLYESSQCTIAQLTAENERLREAFEGLLSKHTHNSMLVQYWREKAGIPT